MTNTITTYTVLDYNGEVEETGLTLAQAGAVIASHDSQEYAIRASDSKYGGFDLWVRKECANKPWTQTVAFSLDTDEDAATEEIFEFVATAGWTNQHIMADEEYAAMMAELMAELADDEGEG